MSDPIPVWRRYLRFFGPDPGADVEDELRFHLEERIDALVAGGLDRETARREAERRLGDVNGIRRELTRMGQKAERTRRHRESATGLVRDASHAARRLAKDRLFAATALATLALGVGAAVAMFTVVNGVMLRPLPYPAPERLVRLSPGQNFNMALADEVSDVPALSASTGISFWGLTLMGEADHRTEFVDAQVVDAGYFDVFGVMPALGRPFRPEERTPALSGVVILTDGLWRTRFGGDPDVIGRRIRLDGYGHRVREVVGVMPPGFRPWGRPGQESRVLIPLNRPGPRTVATDSTWYVNYVIARLAPRATVDAAAAQVRARTDRLVEAYPGVLDESTRASAGAMGLLDSMVGDVRRTLLTLLAAVGVVVVLACANLANLMLARGEQRRQELAVRAALGAGRMRLVREQLVESFMLAAAGGALGLGLSRALLGALRITDASVLPRSELAALDGRVVAFAFGLSLLAALGFGLLPALRATRGDVREDLGSGQRQLGRSRPGRRSGFALVASEVALATMLVAGAALLLSSLRALRSVDPGLDPSDVLAVEVAAPPAGYGGDRARAFYAALIERLEAMPGVRRAGGIHLTPFTESNWGFPYLAEGMEPPPGPLPSANFRVVTPGYFETVGQPVLSGRDIASSDQSPDAALVGLINRRFADELWPGEDPLGRTIRLFGSTPFTIIGVVGDVHQHALDREPRPEMYLAHGGAWSLAAMVVMAETEGGPAALVPAVRAAVAELDPDVAVVRARPLHEVLGDSMVQRRFFAGVLTFFGVLALALGAVGVYGVMSYTMGARRAEYGIRMALGARREGVLRSALSRGMAPVAAGLVLGVLASLAGGRLLGSLLFGVRPGDPLTVAAAAGVLGIVAFTAVFIPALRIARVDAARVLRAR
ncbi:MAG: ABC transporter permease [Gemmatimonadetes bacterium]|nr:ABC transporter permease [Gemmatimonadota bacterium]